ncbi:DUF5034 domain-containing protein [Fibrella forsythiae]|uniref:DUF5034 domain-containing protein n=1 Tax=Fibrella forsythiae TaxID=2817061 RepID=A0ABS3JMX5_9BACT|nr:DUF5034 domain-containing protein [Fibrella forsythiae]MBO0951357.1 DUF5034 domain-containing protein [Fibrella forsythiae]
MKRTILLLLIFIGPVLITGLVGCEVCNTGPTRFTVGGYYLSLQKAGVNPSFPTQIGNVAPGDTVLARNLQIRLFGEEVFAALLSGGGSNLFACDPAIIPFDVIKRLSIVSDQPFSTDLPAGTNLTSVLTVEYGVRAAVDYFSQPNVPAQNYVFTILKAPATLAKHRFTVQVDLRNGKTFADTTMAVVIKP